MFRTLLVLLFLAACGVYFHHTTPEVTTSQPVKQEKRLLDDAILQALKQALPAHLFEKDVKPAIEQNKSGELNSEQLTRLMKRLNEMSKELSGKAADAASNAAKRIEQTLPKEKSSAEKGTETAGELARKAGDELKKSLPVLKELSSDVINGMVTVLSQLLSSAAELLKK